MIRCKAKYAWDRKIEIRNIGIFVHHQATFIEYQNVIHFFNRKKMEFNEMKKKLVLSLKNYKCNLFVQKYHFSTEIKIDIENEPMNSFRFFL